MALSQRAIKRRVDSLFAVHSAAAAVSGSLAVILPHLFEWIMVHHGEVLALRDNSPGQKIEHLTIRMYGMLILGQAWITHSARKSSDGVLRRALIQAYWFVFTGTALALLRAQLTPGGAMSSANWVNIFGFVGLAVAYGWFSFFEKTSAFEGLGKMAV